MGKTVEQLGELIQRLVENGVVRSDTKLDIDDYTHLVFSARDYLLYQRKIGGMTVTNSQVMSAPKIYAIKNSKVELEEGFCVQGIDGAILLDASEGEIDELLVPASPSKKLLLSKTLFTYYLPNTDYIEFVNLPKNARKLKLFTIAGSSAQDVVSEDIAFMIIQQVMKLGQMSEQVRTDTSADGNNFDDYLKNQIRQFMNAPNNIA